MATEKSAWQTKESAMAFLQGVRGAIPGADFQLSVLNKIVYLWCPQPRRILDLGCGDGILGRFLRDACPTAHVSFVDFSSPMLEVLREKLERIQNVAVINADFSTPAWLDALGTDGSFDIVVSGFAIHHQPDVRKKTLYSEIYGLLSEGGVFLNLEHVASLAPSGEQLFDEFFVDHLCEFHQKVNPNKTRQEIAETYYNRPDKRENMLAPLQMQCEWLQEIGFRDVDCFFKVFELALFGARKGTKKLDSSSA